jgi:hypothetical protein
MPRLDARRAATNVLPLLAAVAAALICYQGALHYFFSQDDFLGLAQAAGLAPRLGQPWRYIANQAVWDLLSPFGPTHAAPYHLLSLLAHATCTALLYDALARRVAPSAALIGAVFFAVHPAIFTAVYWISAVGDPLALGFGLLALRACERTDRRRWLAVPLFGVSLLCKETLILLPALIVAGRAGLPKPGAGARPRAMNDVVIALTGVSIAYLVYFVTFAYGTYFVSSAAGAHDPAAHAAYALGWGDSLWRNLLTYLGWTAQFALPAVQGFSDAVDPSVYPWAAGAAVVWLAGLFVPGLRARGWRAGGIAWLLLVLPLLPLRHHTYHYYLYAPLAGAALCVAGASDWALGRTPRPKRGSSPGPAAAWSAAALVSLLLAINGVMLVHKIETMPFVLPELRAEPTVDRARIARNVFDDLAAARLPGGVTLLFWSPQASSIGPHGEAIGHHSATETYWERNVRNALVGGLAVRVMFPQVAAVRFVREFQPAPSDHRYAIYRPEGHVRVVTPAQLDSILTATGARR